MNGYKRRTRTNAGLADVSIRHGEAGTVYPQDSTISNIGNETIRLILLQDRRTNDMTIC